MSKLHLFFSVALLFTLARTAELSKVHHFDLIPSFSPLIYTNHLMKRKVRIACTLS